MCLNLRVLSQVDNVMLTTSTLPTSDREPAKKDELQKTALRRASGTNSHSLNRAFQNGWRNPLVAQMKISAMPAPKSTKDGGSGVGLVGRPIVLPLASP